jgi:hypothetical protein
MRTRPAAILAGRHGREIAEANMKIFAIVLLVLLVLATLFGLGDTFLGNEAERAIGPVIVGGGFTSILLCCVVILLVDIRAAVTAARN